MSKYIDEPDTKQADLDKKPENWSLDIGLGMGFIERPRIYHETGKSSHHSINNLLQGPFFSRWDVSKIESHIVKQTGINIDRFLQVLRHIFKKHNANLYVVNHWDTINHMNEDGLLINKDNHWFVIRKVSDQWFQLDALLPKPVLVTDQDLRMKVTKLINDGYSVFLVRCMIWPQYHFDSFHEDINLYWPQYHKGNKAELEDMKCQKWKTYYKTRTSKVLHELMFKKANENK
eukprot:7469_1